MPLHAVFAEQILWQASGVETFWMMSETYPWSQVVSACSQEGKVSPGWRARERRGEVARRSETALILYPRRAD